MRWQVLALAFVLGALVAAVSAGGSTPCGPDLQVHRSGAFMCAQPDQEVHP